MNDIKVVQPIDWEKYEDKLVSEGSILICQ